MKYYQPYGGGLDSVSMKIRLDREVEEGIRPPYESVFVNHGGDLPCTYEHIDIMREHGYKITVIKPDVQGFDNIYDYFYSLKMVPLFMSRSCTAKFKARPQRKYYKAKGEPYTLYIGFNYDEKHRVKPSHYKHVTIEYPLIEWKTRKREIPKLIEKAGIPVPEPSDCYFCMFHSKEAWYSLMKKNPEYFWKAVELEDNSPNVKLVRRGKLRNLWPPPATFQEVDMSCKRCLFGLET